MLGSVEEARFIRDWCVEQRSEPDYDRYTIAYPQGWQKLGQGCYRTAFLAPSGVVYKVQHMENSYQSNKGEDATLRSVYLKKMPAGCRLPRWSYYELGGPGGGVLAMERFVKLLNNFSAYTDEGSQYWDRKRHLSNMFPDCYDFHGANLAVDVENKLLVPIDVGG